MIGRHQSHRYLHVIETNGGNDRVAETERKLSMEKMGMICAHYISLLLFAICSFYGVKWSRSLSLMFLNFLTKHTITLVYPWWLSTGCFMVSCLTLSCLLSVYLCFYRVFLTLKRTDLCVVAISLLLIRVVILVLTTDSQSDKLTATRRKYMDR